MTTDPDLFREPDRVYNATDYLHVLTLWQPWASLMAWGDKTYETRPRLWHCLNWVAIHASSGKPFTPTPRTPFEQNLNEALERHKVALKDLPGGAILAVVRVREIFAAVAAPVDDRERSFGDYSESRYAYATACRGELPQPIPWKGAQGLQIAPWELRKQIAEALRK